MKLAYWTKYERLFKNFSPLQVYGIVLEFARALGDPYPRQKRGRPPKLLPHEYAAYIAYQILMRNSPFRVMEYESTLYLRAHVDHSTLTVNFERISHEYFLDLVEQSGAYLERLLDYSEQYVIDSTAVTSPLVFLSENKGRIVEEKIEYRSHVIASIHKADHTVCIRKALATTKQVADCEGARRMIAQGDLHNIILHGDRGYDYERVYQACNNANIKPNIRPQSYLAREETERMLGLLEYSDEKRKATRGIIETIFGGLTNAKLLITRLRIESKILAYCAIVLLRHNVLSILRNMNY